MENKKVLLGMSGGSSCCNTETYIDAKKICSSIGIPHIIYNQKEEFRCKVIDNFIEEYSNQRTPNPCIECNKHMKFGSMYEKAKELGCEYIATGHYAKMEYSEKYNQYVLRKSNNLPKDQSYVLYNMPKELLGKVLFPLGEFSSKDEVRKIARENNLKVANKPDSEDICFVPDGDYKKFLENNSDLKPKIGNIVLSTGEVVGKHQGLYRYTIGQRRGLGISYKVPLFVIGFDNKKNELIVGEEAELYTKEFVVNEVNLLLVDEIKESMRVEVKTRYSSKNAKATITQEGENIKVILDEPQRAITPGQSAVFYNDDVVIGGGKIC